MKIFYFKALMAISLATCFCDALAADVFVGNVTALRNACINAIPGTVIKIAPGTYDLSVNGSLQLVGKNNVTLQPNGGDVYLTGNPNPMSTGITMLVIQNSSNITITGLKFHNNWGNGAKGIYVTGAGDNVIITSCEFYDIGWSQDKQLYPAQGNNAHAIHVLTSSDPGYTHITIQNNIIRDCITGYSENLTISGNVDGFLVENNTISGGTNIGMDFAGYFTHAPESVNYARNGVVRKNHVYNYEGPDSLPVPSGIYVDGGSSVIVEKNIVHDYVIGITVGCEVPGKTNHNNIVRNNIVYNNRVSGMYIGPSGGSSSENTQVTNNTFYHNSIPDNSDNGQIALLNATGSVIKNNILIPHADRWAVGQMSQTTSTGTIIDYNLYYRDNGVVTNLYHNIIQDVNPVKQDPLFVNPVSNNFHLSVGSPAINAGDPGFSAAPSEMDIDDQPRVDGNRVDIGSDEYITPPPPAAPTNLEAHAVNWSQIDLIWDFVNGVTYNIHRAPTDTGIYTQIATGITITFYRDSGLISNKTYRYKVSASNAGGTSPLSSWAEATTLDAPDFDGTVLDWPKFYLVADWGAGGMSAMSAGENKSSLFIMAEGTQVDSYYQIFIDTDSDNTGSGEFVGSSWPSTGFNYMIENGSLYTYTGRGTDWAWTKKSSVETAQSSTAIEVGVVKTDLGTLASTIKLAVASLDKNWKITGLVPEAGKEGVPYKLSDPKARMKVLPEEKPGTRTEASEEQDIQVYPNPTHAAVTVEYLLKSPSLVSIDLFDITGKHIRNCENNTQAAGRHQKNVRVDSPSGLYIIKIFKEGKIEHKLLRIE